MAIIEGQAFRKRLADLRRMADRFPGTPGGRQAQKELEYLERKEKATTARCFLPIVLP